MSKLSEVLTREYVNSILQYGVTIGEMIEKLEQKGEELTKSIKSLEDLEGKSESKGDKNFLIACPMTKVLGEIKKANAELTGVEELPDFYPEIVKEYIKEHPDDAAILHPLCIVHQHIRNSFGKKQGLVLQQIACRSLATGKVVYSKKGIKEAATDEKQVDSEIANFACLYLCKKCAK